MYKTFDTRISTALQRMGKTAPWFWNAVAGYVFNVFIVVGVCFAWLMPFGRWLTVLALPLLGCYVTTLVVQLIIRRPRPPHTQHGFHLLLHTYSFPSAHASSSFAVAVLLSATALLVVPEVASIFIPAVFAVAVMIALSRIVVGVHYPSDVVVGALLGTVLASLFAYFVVLA